MVCLPPVFVIKTDYNLVIHTTLSLSDLFHDTCIDAESMHEEH